MSRDMLGPLTRALLGTPKKYLGIVLDVVRRLAAQDTEKVAMFARDLKLFLRGKLVDVRPQRTFKTLCILKLGTGLTTADDFSEAIMCGGMQTGYRAHDILGKPGFGVNPGAIEVELVVASVAELGFKNSAKFSAICSRIRELGYDLCPNEVGPQLRLQYKNQPRGERLIIAMEPIVALGSYLGVFEVIHDMNGLWISSDSGHPDSLWPDKSLFVFVRRQIVVSRAS